MKLFAVTAPGLAGCAALELRGLGLLPENGTFPAELQSPAGSGGDIEAGGIAFEGDLAALYRANLHLRTASRVLVRLGEFRATSFAELRNKAGRLGWEQFFAAGQPAVLHVTCRKSRLYHSDAVAERVAGAIGDRLGKPTPLHKAPADEDGQPAMENRAVSSAQLVIVRVLNDFCTISVDSSGDLLHRRGYRLASAKAPLRETLAAALLAASGWDGASPLMDPFCGSGTIPIEAAMLAAGIPPGCKRRFAFMDWPGFEAHVWSALMGEARPRIDKLPAILASDRDAGAVQMARDNAERAGVGDRIEFSQRAVSALEPSEGPGWVVTNPPYGLRVSGGKDLRNLYAQFGNVLRKRCPEWRVAILCSDLRLLGQVGLRLDTSMGLVNGGIKVRLGIGEVQAAS